MEKYCEAEFIQIC